MTKILFPFKLDGPLFYNAYIFAVKFARNMNAELIMLNVFNIEDDNNIATERHNYRLKQKWVKSYNQMIRLNNHYLEHHARINNELKLRFDYRFIRGKLVPQIKEILKNETIDLVVLPVSNNKGINKKQLKIIRDDIFEKNRAGLLVVPFNSSFSSISTIVFATDLKKLSFHELYIKDIVKYAKIFNSNIHFLHISQTKEAVLPEDTEAYRTVMQIIRDNKKHVFKNLYGKDVIGSIQKYITDNNADLLAVVKHEQFFLDTLFHKSINDKHSLNSKIPVLVMREKEEG